MSATIAPLTPAPVYPLTRDPDTVLLFQGFDQITGSAADGVPLSGQGDGTFRGVMDIVNIGGVPCITPKTTFPTNARYLTALWPQTCLLDPRQGGTFEVLWAEPTAWGQVPNNSGIFGFGHTSSQGTYRNFDLRVYFVSGKVVCQISHRQGPDAALSTVTATGPNVVIGPDTLAHIAVSVTPPGLLSARVEGIQGVQVQVPNWEWVKGTSGHHYSAYLGGKDALDNRIGWKCGGFKVSASARGSAPLTIPDRPSVTVDFDQADGPKPRMARLHVVGGASGPTPQMALLRTDKFAAGAHTIEGEPDEDHPYAGISGRYSYDAQGVIDWFRAQIADGVTSIMIGSGATPQILGGRFAPKAVGSAWTPVGYSFAPDVPTDFDAYADLRADWWWMLAVEQGLPVETIDFWNEPNLVGGSPATGTFWAGTRAQLIDLQGRIFKRIEQRYQEAIAAGHNPPRPRYIWFSDSGWNPLHVGNRDNAAWYLDIAAYLVANPDVPRGGLGFHAYEGSDACVAGWANFVRETWKDAGLDEPELLVTETLPTSASVSSDPAKANIPFSLIPNFHAGAFAASQLFHQLALYARLGITAVVYASQYVDRLWAGCLYDGGIPRADMNVVRLYDLLGDNIYPASVVGSCSIDALAGKQASGLGSLVVGRSVWAVADSQTIDIDLGPGKAGTVWEVAYVDQALGNAREAGAANAELVWSVVAYVADADGVISDLYLPPWAVVGLRELSGANPHPDPDPTPALYTLAGTLTAPDGTVFTIGPIQVPVVVTPATPPA